MRRKEPQDRLSAGFFESCNEYKYEDKVLEQSKTAKRIQCNKINFQNKLNKMHTYISLRHTGLYQSDEFSQVLILKGSKRCNVFAYKRG